MLARMTTVLMAAALAGGLQTKPYRTAAKVASCVASIACALAAGLLCVMLVVILADGPEMAKRAERERSQQIEQENLGFCENFGIYRNTTRFADCAKGLTEVRRRHAERISEPGVL